MTILMRIILTSCLWLFLSSAQAANQTLPLSSLGYAGDLLVKGANTQTSVFFPIPKADILNSSSIDLYLEPSPYLNNGSTFAVFLNEKPAANLTAGQLRHNPLVKLPLPSGAIAARGVNVSIRTGMFANDNNLCVDYRRGYLFYTLKNTSNLMLDLTPPAPKTIPDFFAGLYQGLVVVLPPVPTLEEIQAGIWLYGAMQKSYPYQNIRISLGTPQGMPPNLPQLWVGERAHLPLNLQGKDENLFLASPDKLIVSADSGSGLLQASRQLLTLPVYAVLPILQSVIDSTTPQGAALPERIYFGNSGVQEGFTTISMDFPLYPGQLAALPKSLGLHLEGRYSPSTVAGKPARLDVYLNRTLLQSMVLDDSGILNRDINLPEGFRLKGRNVLSVTINYPEDEENCAVQGVGENAQLLASSYYVGLRLVDRDQLAWDNVGMLFGRNGLMLLENNPSAEVIKAAAQAVHFLNSQLPPNQFAFPEIRWVSDYKEPVAADYILAITGGGLPEELIKGLPIRIGESSTIYQSNGQVGRITFRAGNATVIGQVGNYQGIPLVVFQGFQAQQRLSEAVYSLIKEFDKGSVTGNLFVYDGNPAFFSTLPPTNLEREGVLRFFSIPWNIWEQIYRFAGSYYKLMFLAILAILMFASFRWLLQHGKKR